MVAEMRGTSDTSVLEGEVLEVGGGVEVEPESSEMLKWVELGDGSAPCSRGRAV